MDVIDGMLDVCGGEGVTGGGGCSSGDGSPSNLPSDAETMSIVASRGAGSFFTELALGLGRVGNTLEGFEEVLKYVASARGQYLDFEALITEESRNALVALGHVIEFAPSNKQAVPHQAFDIRNSPRSTNPLLLNPNKRFTVQCYNSSVPGHNTSLGGSRSQDRTIGTSWRAFYEAGIGRNFGLLDPRGSGRRHGVSNSDTNSNTVITPSSTAHSMRSRAAPGKERQRNVRLECNDSAEACGSQGHDGRSADRESGETVGDQAEGSVDSRPRLPGSPTNESKRKPSFGARVRVCFQPKTWYMGTINSHGDTPEDLANPDGPWSVLFDDCTRERFKEDDKDVEVTDLPRLKRMTMKLQEFFLAQENGLELMEGVKNLSVGPEAAARRTEGLTSYAQASPAHDVKSQGKVPARNRSQTTDHGGRRVPKRLRRK